MTGFLLDTHIWVWAQRRDSSQLTSAAFNHIENWQRDGSAYLSPISAWELALLVESSHINLVATIDEFVQEATRDGGLQILPLTPSILIESTRLPGDLHRDPADRILAATARSQGLTLVTRDKALLRYGKAGHLSVRKL